jgi:outer membrane protein assembly factor BamB
MTNSTIRERLAQNVPASLFRFDQFLFLLATLGIGVSVVAQDIVPPPAPPGTANYIQWDGSAYRIGFGWDNPDGSITPMGRTSGGLEPDDSGPPTPYVGTGGGGGTTVTYNLLEPGTNLWLFITQISTNEVQVTLSNTIPGLPYVLEIATNLLGPWYTNQSLLATNTVSLAQPVLIDTSYEGVFFRALQAVPRTVRWAVQLYNPATATNQDAFGYGMDASPALSPDGQTVYMATASNTLYAVDFLTGIVKWSDRIFNGSLFASNGVFPQPAEMTSSPIVSPSGQIFVGSTDGHLYVINPDGTTNAVFNLGNFSAIYSTPSLGTNGEVYVTTDETLAGRVFNPITGLTSLNSISGATNWMFQPQDLFYGNAGDIDCNPVVAADGTVYFLAEGHRLYAISSSGNLKWFLPVAGDDEPDSSPAIDSDGNIVIGSYSDYLYKVAPDGSLMWIFDVVQPDGSFGVIQSGPTIGPDNEIYFGIGSSYSEDYFVDAGDVFCINSDGTQRWMFGLDDNYVSTSVALGTGGWEYFGCDDGGLYALTNGVQAWTFYTGSPILSSPLIAADGTIIFGCDNGTLYALWGSGSLETNAPWPMYQQNPSHTGQQGTVVPVGTTCNPPFLSQETNSISGEFTFRIVGQANTLWNVYSSTNLSNWVEIASNLPLNAAGSTNASGTNTFTDTSVTGGSQRFYQLCNSNCCSRIIGFVNLTIAPGTNLVANQLYQVDDEVEYLEFYAGGPEAFQCWPMNTLSALFTLVNPWSTTQDPTQVFKWNGTSFNADSYNDAHFPTWLSGGDMTLIPGSSVLVSNGTGHSFTASFAGLVQEQQVFHITSKTNYLSSTFPMAGAITNVTGYLPQNGDIVQVWSTNTQAYISHTYSSGTWSSGVPMLNVGQGFVLITTNTYTWTNGSN